MANEKILVVDDDTNICELLRLYLTKEGYQVTTANDGEEGLEKFNQLKPDMVLLLPVVVGISYEIIRFAGRHNNPVTRVISAPGLWLQRLTTFEPDLTQLEVAIAAMKPCIPENGTDDLY